MLIIKYKDGDVRGVRCDDFQITKTRLVFYVVNQWNKDDSDFYVSEKWYSMSEDTEIYLSVISEIIIDGQVVFKAKDEETEEDEA